MSEHGARTMEAVRAAMAQPADATLDEMAKSAARRAANVCGVSDDIIAVKEIYRAIVSVANGYAALAAAGDRTAALPLSQRGEKW